MDEQQKPSFLGSVFSGITGAIKGGVLVGLIGAVAGAAVGVLVGAFVPVESILEGAKSLFNVTTPTVDGSLVVAGQAAAVNAYQAVASLAEVSTAAAGAMIGGAALAPLGIAAGATYGGITGILQSREKDTPQPSAQDIVNVAKVSFAQGRQQGIMEVSTALGAAAEAAMEQEHKTDWSLKNPSKKLEGSIAKAIIRERETTTAATAVSGPQTLQ